jgi:hypothetical protein
MKSLPIDQEGQRIEEERPGGDRFIQDSAAIADERDDWVSLG